jgi:hypothetical protein
MALPSAFLAPLRFFNNDGHFRWSERARGLPPHHPLMPVGLLLISAFVSSCWWEMKADSSNEKSVESCENQQQLEV